MKSFKTALFAASLSLAGALVAAPALAHDARDYAAAESQIDLGALLPLLYQQCGENAAICEQIGNMLLGMAKGGTLATLETPIPTLPSEGLNLGMLLPLLSEQCKENASICQQVGEAILEYVKTGEMPKLPAAALPLVHQRDSGLSLDLLLPLLYKECKEYESVCQQIGDAFFGFLTGKVAR